MAGFGIDQRHNLILIKILKTLRLQKRMSQKELATKLTTNQSFISKYESGERRIDVVELRIICKALNSSIDYVIGQMNKEISRL